MGKRWGVDERIQGIGRTKHQLSANVVLLEKSSKKGLKVVAPWLCEFIFFDELIFLRQNYGEVLFAAPCCKACKDWRKPSKIVAFMRITRPLGASIT